MSKENVKMFFAELEKNSELKAKYLNAIKEYQVESEKILAEKMISIASKAGFSFSNSDLNEVRSEFMDQVNGSGELKDGDLKAVAGGAVNPGMVLASIFTAGIACAAVSLAYARQGTCGKVFETK